MPRARRLVLPVILLAIVMIGLWKWLGEGDAIEGLGGIFAAFAVWIVFEAIYRRSAKFGG